MSDVYQNAATLSPPRFESVSECWVRARIVACWVVLLIRALAWLGNVVDIFQVALVRLSHCRGVELSRSICDSGTAICATCASTGTKVVAQVDSGSAFAIWLASQTGL